MSIVTLMAMPRARGLFRQAVTQSGAAAQTLTADAALRVGSMLAESLGVAPTRETFSEVPVERLVRAASAIAGEVQAGPDPATPSSVTLHHRLSPTQPTAPGSASLPTAIRAGPGYSTVGRSTALIDEGITVADDPDGAEREVWASRR